jgi:hypothetical protein
MGAAEHAKGAYVDDTWTWTNEERIAGKPFKGRFTIRQISSKSYVFKFDMLTERWRLGN